MSSPEQSPITDRKPAILTNEAPPWQVTSYAPIHTAYKTWVDAGDSRRRRHRLGYIPYDVLEQDSAAFAFLKELQETVATANKNYGLRREDMTLYQKEDGWINYGVDPIDTILDKLLHYQGEVRGTPFKRISTVIGNNYPKEWKYKFPKATVSVYDVSPYQHVKGGHCIQSPKGAAQGYLVNAGVRPWFTEFLNLTKPEILYLSNIPSFLAEEKPAQLDALTAVICDQVPEIVVSTQLDPLDNVSTSVARQLEPFYLQHMFSIPSYEAGLELTIFTRRDVPPLRKAA